MCLCPATINRHSERRRAMRRRVIGLVACACLLQVHGVTAQGLTGALIGSVRDAQGEVVSGAVVRLSSPALIGARKR